MITPHIRNESNFPKLYETAIGAIHRAERMSATAVGADEREADRIDALRAAAAALPGEVHRLTTAAENGLELLSELLAMVYRTIEPVAGERFAIRGSEPFCDLVSGLAHNDTRVVSTGLLLSDLSNSWEAITDFTATKEEKAVLDEAKAAIKDPRTWPFIWELTIVARGLDRPDVA